MNFTISSDDQTIKTIKQLLTNVKIERLGYIVGDVLIIAAIFLFCKFEGAAYGAMGCAVLLVNDIRRLFDICLTLKDLKIVEGGGNAKQF
jgi:hypothetical protein